MMYRMIRKNLILKDIGGNTHALIRLIEGYTKDPKQNS